MRNLITGPTLAEVMERRTLSMSEVLSWAPEIAASLEALHRQGRCHGQVSATAVRIEGHSALLMPGSKDFEAGNQPQDIAQFAEVLKAMLKRTPAETDAEQADWRVLNRIATTNAKAAEGSRMKKVTAALKLVRPHYRLGLMESAEPTDAVEAERPRLRRVMMLVREVPKDTPTNLPKVHAKTLHIWAYFASAAGIAVTVCMVYLKFLR